MDAFSFDVILKIIVTISFGVFFTALTDKSIIIFFKSLAKKSLTNYQQQRILTLKQLTINIANIIIFLTLLLMILNDLGFNIVPILTGAGILGVTISFGSQTLIKDFLAGFFIILENQFNIGDEVKIGEYTGKITKISFRTITITDKKNNLIYIPNSEIKSVVVYKK